MLRRHVLHIDRAHQRREERLHDRILLAEAVAQLADRGAVGHLEREVALADHVVQSREQPDIYRRHGSPFPRLALPFYLRRPAHTRALRPSIRALYSRAMPTLLDRASRVALDLLFPPRCGICRAGGSLLCADCIGDLPVADGRRCQRCWMPVAPP